MYYDLYQHMIISFKKSTRHFAHVILCGLVLFALIFTTVVNASADTTAVCKDMVMQESMAESADCCELDVMPDCCKTCNASVQYFSDSIEFSIDKPEAATVGRVVLQYSSINPPPLLRPPVIS
jgi:hypothetical protein